MVSVCMATYNGEKYLAEQLVSILSELQPNDELVISDDSSTDSTLQIIREMFDQRIILLTDNKFRDPIKNFQNCLQYAKGDYIFLADQDDVWIKGKRDKMVGLLHSYDLVISDSIVVDENLKTISPSFFEFFGSGKGILKNVWRSSYYGSCMAFRKTLLVNALPFPDTKEIGHDLWIGLVAELTGSVLFLKEPLLLYRRHADSFTVTGLRKSNRSLLAKIAGRLVMIKALSKFMIKQYA